MTTIDLSKLTEGKVRNLTGHERGLAARQEFSLDELDRSIGEITVLVPEDLDSITTSFFQGMFSKSVHTASSSFLDKYHFNAKPIVMEQIIRAIDRVNTKRGSVF